MLFGIATIFALLCPIMLTKNLYNIYHTDIKHESKELFSGYYMVTLCMIYVVL